MNEVKLDTLFLYSILALGIFNFAGGDQLTKANTLSMFRDRLVACRTSFDAITCEAHSGLF